MHAASIDHARLLSALRSEGAVLAATDADALTAPVPTCPGWCVADVLGHLGRVYRSVADIVATRASEPPTQAPPKAPAGAAVPGFFADGLATLADTLEGTDPATPVYTWSEDQTVGFYRRRMAHETAVHRIDVDLALGRPVATYDGDLAADGVDELYTVVLPFGLSRRPDVAWPAGSLHLHRTDGAGEWTLDVVDGSLTVGHAHGKATAAVRGPASDLFAFAWNRGRAATLEVFGDEAVAAAWAGLAP